MTSVYAFLMFLNSMFGVEQTGKAYHIDKASYQSLQCCEEYQALVASNPDAIKFSGNKDNIVVIIDQNEF
jgi:hypothetical protein